MSEPIKVGDLVMVKRCCCEPENCSGVIATVTRIYSASEPDCLPCKDCGASYEGQPCADLEGLEDAYFLLSWLKKIPPLEELQTYRLTDETTT